MAKGDEKELQTRLLNHIKNNINLNEYSFEIKEGVQVPKDFTYIPYKNQFCLGGVQTDIAIYKNIGNKFKSDLIYFTQFPKSEEINIPFIIIELKSGDLTSDAIRARDLVARDVKNLFPHVSYIFIAEKTNKKIETLLRQGKNFNNFYLSKKPLTIDDFKKITELIETTISVMKQNEFI